MIDRLSSSSTMSVAAGGGLEEEDVGDDEVVRPVVCSVNGSVKLTRFSDFIPSPAGVDDIFVAVAVMNVCCVKR